MGGGNTPSHFMPKTKRRICCNCGDAFENAQKAFYCPKCRPGKKIEIAARAITKNR